MRACVRACCVCGVWRCVVCGVWCVCGVSVCVRACVRACVWHCVLCACINKCIIGNKCTTYVSKAELIRSYLSVLESARKGNTATRACSSIRLRCN